MWDRYEPKQRSLFFAKISISWSYYNPTLRTNCRSRLHILITDLSWHYYHRLDPFLASLIASFLCCISTPLHTTISDLNCKPSPRWMVTNEATVLLYIGTVSLLYADMIIGSWADFTKRISIIHWADFKRPSDKVLEYTFTSTIFPFTSATWIHFHDYNYLYDKTTKS